MGACPCFGSRKAKKSRKDKEKEALNKAKTQLSSGAEMQVLKREAGQRAAAPAPRRGPNFDTGLPIFSYRVLATATNNFRNDSLIGRGGFGAVYKGRLENGQMVAVKQLDKTGLQGDKEFLVEVLMLSLLRHTNLVSLIGYCAEGEQRLLVYEYMPLGSLEYHLHDLTRDQKPLDWNTRMKIAAGAAKGLEYLHTGAQPPVIYRDLKSSNILLGEGYYPKLSDFGLAKFGPSGDASHVSTRVMGTHGYCAPEYMISGKLTMRSDIYSFGVFLLELISGRKALDETRERDQRSIVEWARPRAKENKNVLLLADPRLNNQFPKSTFRNVVEVAMLCTQENATARPTVTDLVRALDFLASNTYNPNEDRRSAVSEDQPNEDSPKKTARTLEKDMDREKAVAEAKMWGETWREKRRLQQTADKDADGVNDR